VSSRGRSISVRATELRALLLAGLLALGLGLSACGGEESPAEARDDRLDEVVDISGTDPVGQERAGSVAPLAMCGDWNEGSEEERRATIADIRAQLAPQDSGIQAPELTDEEATEVFDNACEPSWAGGFRLYKLYARAVGFVEVKRALEE
jgi:hypothetical protein